MITSERAYRNTKLAAQKFDRAIEEMKAKMRGYTGRDLESAKHILAGMESQLKDLQYQMQDYEALRAGKRAPVINLTEIYGLPDRLIGMRIARGWTQKQLADRLGIAERQVQRYEAARYASASLKRIEAIAQVLVNGDEAENSQRASKRATGGDRKRKPKQRTAA